MKKIKLIIDTDIGNDIDDAFAICLAMQSPEIELVAVSTVYRDTIKRAQMAKALLNSGGFSHVPVFAGEKRPLATNQLYGNVIDANETPKGYREEYKKIEIDGENAVSSIAEILLNSPEKITILTIGALTNVAKLLTAYPEVKDKIEKIFVMGGAYDWNLEEYNFACDPYAAAKVMDSSIELYCVGVDITFKCKLKDEYYQKLENAKSQTLKILWDMKASWTQAIHLHDPLTLMCVYSGEKYVKYEKRNCKVEYNSNYSNGRVINFTDFNWAKKPCENINVAISVNGDLAVNDCVERLLNFEK